ncbi:hypothetical protein C8T65DRAFT_728688 [Cerioporus squamosus]|nr:hypothetical protein C8T65DRAFT_728688 [Cerioporus squamosus]
MPKPKKTRKNTRVYMTSLSSVLHVPPKIKNVAFPANPLNRYNNIGRFVFWNLSQALSSEPHYEVSIYGAFNAYLGAIFPLDRYFLVKPQGMIRPVLDSEPLLVLGDIPDGDPGGTGVAGAGGGNGGSGSPLADQSHATGDPSSSSQDRDNLSHSQDPDNDDNSNMDANEVEADFSFGSYMGGHMKRGQGREVGKDFVDFVVVKVVVCDDATTKCHIPVLLVEVKRCFDARASTSARLQMMRYMSDMATQETCPRDLVGYLVQGRIGIRFHLIQGVNGTLQPREGPEFDILSDDTMSPELVQIAQDKWGLLSIDE